MPLRAHRRVALEAVADGGEVEAVLHRVLQHRRGVLFLGTWRRLRLGREAVDRIRHFVLDRLQRAQVGDDGVHVAVGDDLVESDRHHCRDRDAVRPHAGAQQVLDLRVGPGTDAGLLVLGDVRRRHLERRLVPRQAAGEVLAGNVALRPFRRMAIAAGHDGVDEIVAALDQIGLRIGGASRRHGKRRGQHERAKHCGISPRPLRRACPFCGEDVTAT